MGLTKTEINLRRLLAAMPEQTNQAKLAQYIVTLKEQLALLTGESGQGNLPCITEEKAKEYAEQIEAAASRIDTDGLDMWEMLTSKDAQSDFAERPRENLPSKSLEDSSTESGLRRRLLSNSNASNNKGASVRHNNHKHDPINGGHGQKSEAGSDRGSAMKAELATLELIEKHRHLQEDLTDEMVGLARQMKEASRSMNQAVLDSDKVLDSTEQAVERNLASTSQANKRAQDIYSQSFKTGCLTWLIVFVMCCMFMLMVFLIRIT